MDVRDALRQRRMVRSFDATPVDETWLRDTCAEALRSPTAGNTAGVRMAIVPSEHVGAYFTVATDEQWRENARRAPGLMRCGAVVLVTSRPSDYTARYGEEDKAASGLDDEDNWTVPYWHADAAMATMSLLLLIEEAGLKATIWGNFRHEDEVLRWAGLVDEALFCTVLLGTPDGNDVTSASLQRDVLPREQRVRVVRPTS